MFFWSVSLLSLVLQKTKEALRRQKTAAASELLRSSFPSAKHQQQQRLESLLTTATIQQQISPNRIIDNAQIMEYTGAFGASTLFLILPALMVWQNRYGEESRPLTVKPMFPLGKISLGSLYKAAGTLIVEQGLEKLGVFEFVSEHFLNNS